jgi:hypothetical protein
MPAGPFKYMVEPSAGTRLFLTANFAVRVRRVKSEEPPPPAPGRQVDIIGDNAPQLGRGIIGDLE